MQAPGVPDIIDFETWFFLQWRGATPDCGEDAGRLGCGGALHMLCARNITGDAKVWWPFEACVMANQTAIPGNAGECAAAHGVDAAALEACAGGAAGDALLRESAARTADASVGWTPWLVVDGEMRMPAELDYLKMVCDAYNGTRPAGCP